MDDKAKLILKSYKFKLEEFRFDELDILGFLIFIRQYITEQYFPAVQEFCDLIAHRNRDRGRAMRSIEKAYNNNFDVNEEGKVKGSEGIYAKDWRDEWIRLFSKFGIEFSDAILKELTLCIISLAQETEYQSSIGSGNLVVFIDDENNIDLCYRINSPNSLYVTFLKSGRWLLSDDCPKGDIQTPIITVRKNRQLRVKCEDQFIV